VEEYPEIWYLGLDACKIHGDPQSGGFDDDNGSYNKVSSKETTWQYVYSGFVRWDRDTKNTEPK
jgi:dual specificity tyrosine-phosphorylation-regulated kinase 2/3/4